jgi:hypothetical protein
MNSRPWDERIQILPAEDNSGDVVLIREAFKGLKGLGICSSFRMVKKPLTLSSGSTNKNRFHAFLFSCWISISRGEVEPKCFSASGRVRSAAVLPS